MKQIWKTPQLEVLDVRMTMKHHGDEAGGDGDGLPEDGDGGNSLDS
ncbi:paeninodin family lasso peptide [Virgibacillus sp. W0181]